MTTQTIEGADVSRGRMMIRRATAEDIPAIVTMAQTFAASPLYAAHVTVSVPHLTRLIASFLVNEDALALIAARDDGSLVGMIGMLICEHPVSGQRVATELAWWVDADTRGVGLGVKLLRAAEAWAAERGAEAMQMGAPTERVGEFYQAMGYARVETSYQRRLG